MLEYIIAEDDDKKSNKKHKRINKNGNLTKKKVKQQEKIEVNTLNVNNDNSINTLEIEKEIQDFKSKIEIETVHAANIRKFKPKISKEWVQELANL